MSAPKPAHKWSTCFSQEPAAERAIHSISLKFCCQFATSEIEQLICECLITALTSMRVLISLRSCPVVYAKVVSWISCQIMRTVDEKFKIMRLLYWNTSSFQVAISWYKHSSVPATRATKYISKNVLDFLETLSSHFKFPAIAFSSLTNSTI